LPPVENVMSALPPASTTSPRGPERQPAPNENTAAPPPEPDQPKEPSNGV
jgi:hypothetical protein